MQIHAHQRVFYSQQGEIEKLFDVPQEIYDSEYGEVGATSSTVLRCYIG